MLSDIEISRQSPRLPIAEVAAQLGIAAAHLHPHGHYKGKLDLALLHHAPAREPGKLVLVSAITPTPLGEGKTVTTIGLSMGLNHIGQPSIATIRQPSLGPVFGVKGGAAGGGMAQVVPMEEMNLHLTGDFHALTAAHNLASAALDARLQAAPMLRLAALGQRLDALDRIRTTLGYTETLQRGYAVVRGDGHVVTSKAAAEKAQALEIQFADGRLSLGPRPTKKPKPSGPTQGSLF